MRSRFLVVALVIIPGAAWPQGDPVGPEFRVNTFTTNTQRYSSIAAGASGSSFVVVWASSNQDGSGMGVYGQRYISSGAPAGPEFRVNTYTTDQQSFPVVASDASDNFVVVWQSRQDGSDYSIFGQRYASSGAPLGPEFRVNTYTTGLQTRPAVVTDSAGDFVVVWQGGSTFNYDVFGQRYASSGTPLGPEFRVNTYAAGSLSPKPSIGSDTSGNFVVAWEGFYGFEISGQRYSSSGAPLGSEFPIAIACLPCSVRSPAVAADSAGNFVVVWVSNYPYGGDNNSIAGRRYASSGAALGNAFRVNTYMTNYQVDPAVAADADGNFVVVWASGGQDGSSDGVFGQRYLSTGAPLGAEFRVNTYTEQAQAAPSVAADAAGNFVVTWDSTLQDGSAYSIYGQRYSMIVPVELMQFRVE